MHTCTDPDADLRLDGRQGAQQHVAAQRAVDLEALLAQIRGLRAAHLHVERAARRPGTRRRRLASWARAPGAVAARDGHVGAQQAGEAAAELLGRRVQLAQLGRLRALRESGWGGFRPPFLPP